MDPREDRTSVWDKPRWTVLTHQSLASSVTQGRTVVKAGEYAHRERIQSRPQTLAHSLPRLELRGQADSARGGTVLTPATSIREEDGGWLSRIHCLRTVEDGEHLVHSVSARASEVSRNNLILFASRR